MAGLKITSWRKAATLALVAAMAGMISAPASAIESSPLPMEDLFRELTASDPIIRDQMLERKEGIAVFGKAHFKSVGEYPRHERRFRIIATPHEKNFSAIYYLFTNNKNFFRRMKEGSVFDFRGKLVITTSTNLEKDEYIFDIVLDE